MTSFTRLASTAFAAPVLVMTSFLLCRHSLLSWPRPALRTYVTYGHLTAFNIYNFIRHIGSHIQYKKQYTANNTMKKVNNSVTNFQQHIRVRHTILAE